MTEQELISKLQALKQINPRTEWVVLAKTEILSNNVMAKKEIVSPGYQWNFSNILGLFYQRKFAYALASFLFIAVGAFGFVKYVMVDHSNTNVALQSQNLVTMKDSVKVFKIKSQNLSDIAKSSPKDISFAVKEVKAAAKELTDAIKKDPQLAKNVALEVNNNKTYLDIPGGNDAVEVTDVYKTIDDQLIKDLEKVTLTSAQEKEFFRIKNAYDKEGDYSTTLRDILLMNASRDSKAN